jgi:hypothetical protein
VNVQIGTVTGHYLFSRLVKPPGYLKSLQMGTQNWDTLIVALLAKYLDSGSNPFTRIIAAILSAMQLPLH